MIILFEPYILLLKPQSLNRLLLLLPRHNTLILLEERYWFEHFQSLFWMRPSCGYWGPSENSTCSRQQIPVTSKSSQRFHRQLRDTMLLDHLHLLHSGLLGPSPHFHLLLPLAIAAVELFSTVVAKAGLAFTIAESNIELKG